MDGREWKLHNAFFIYVYTNMQKRLKMNFAFRFWNTAVYIFGNSELQRDFLIVRWKGVRIVFTD